MKIFNTGSRMKILEYRKSNENVGLVALGYKYSNETIHVTEME
jgi:hypothetical protein